MSILQISDQKFNSLISVLGVPFVKESDLEINYEQIKDTLILRALREYYRWFPIEDYEVLNINGEFEFNFPDEFVFYAKDIKLNSSRMSTGRTGNPLIDERSIRSSNGYSRSMYGTRFDYGATTANISFRSESQSFVDMNKTFKVRVIENKRIIKGYTNTMGNMEVTWLSYSNDYSTVPFMDESTVDDLSKSYILEFFGDLRAQSAIEDVPEFNFEIMQEKAKELKDSVLEKWKNRGSAIVMRN